GGRIRGAPCRGNAHRSRRRRSRRARGTEAPTDVPCTEPWLWEQRFLYHGPRPRQIWQQSPAVGYRLLPDVQGRLPGGRSAQPTSTSPMPLRAGSVNGAPTWASDATARYSGGTLVRSPTTHTTAAPRALRSARSIHGARAGLPSISTRGRSAEYWETFPPTHMLATT